jgi:hypothetical protein
LRSQHIDNAAVIAGDYPVGFAEVEGERDQFFAGRGLDASDRPSLLRVQRRGFFMLKASLMAASMAVLGLSTAYAAQELCNDAHMKQMDQMIADMTDAAKKKEATEALDQSKAAMKAGDTAQCMKYMDAAHKAMGL